MNREQWISELCTRRYGLPQQAHLRSTIKLTLDEAMEIENLLRAPVDTLAVERKKNYGSLVRGTYCGGCDQKVQQSKIIMSSNLAKMLLWIVRHSPHREWVFMPVAPFQRSRSWSKLKYWGLVVGSDESVDGHQKGYWRPTEEGRLFAGKGSTFRVWDHVFVYNDTVMGHSAETVTLAEAFDHPQDLTRLYEGPANDATLYKLSTTRKCKKKENGDG